MSFAPKDGNLSGRGSAEPSRLRPSARTSALVKARAGPFYGLESLSTSDRDLSYPFPLTRRRTSSLTRNWKSQTLSTTQGLLEFAITARHHLLSFCQPAGVREGREHLYPTRSEERRVGKECSIRWS